MPFRGGVPREGKPPEWRQLEPGIVVAGDPVQCLMKRHCARSSIIATQNGDLFSWMEAGVAHFRHAHQLAICQLDHHLGSIDVARGKGVSKNRTAKDTSDGANGVAADGIASGAANHSTQGAMSGLGLCIRHMDGLATDNRTLCQRLRLQIFRAGVALIA